MPVSSPAQPDVKPPVSSRRWKRCLDWLDQAQNGGLSGPATLRSLFQKESRFLYALLAVCALVYGQYFFSKGFTSSFDIEYHLKCVYFFADSFRDGQWMPRTIAAPQELFEGTSALSDLPVFQYYAFLEGAAALPFMLLGLPALQSMILSVVIGRWIGSIALYYAARLLNSGPLTAFAGAFLYLISPYLVSNFYGRGAIAETWAHSVLPLIPLAWAFALKQRYAPAAAVTALAVALLALSHNIFFFYGSLLIALLAILTFRPKIILALGVGGFIGVCLTAWQWYPAALTVTQTFFGYIYKAAVPFVNYKSASLMGFFGAPALHITRDTNQIQNYFFTVGWWTIPAFILLAKYCRRESQPCVRPLLIAAFVFFVLTYTPFKLYTYLPKVFSCVQDTYRLLSICSLLAAFALPVALAALPSRWAVAGLIFALMSQLPVIVQHRARPFELRDSFIASRPITGDFLALPPNDNEKLRTPEGSLWPDNRIAVNLTQGAKSRLVIQGVNRSGQSVQLYLSNPNHPRKDALSSTPIPPGEFTQSFVINPTDTAVRLHVFPELYDKIHISTAAIESEPYAAHLHFNNVIPLRSHGYTRLFEPTPDARAAAVPDSNGDYHVELPMAHSAHWIASQDNAPVPVSLGLNHRPIVRVTSLDRPIHMTWCIPAPALVLTGIGVLGFALLFMHSRFTLATN